jgi:hypothetical protein
MPILTPSRSCACGQRRRAPIRYPADDLAGCRRLGLLLVDLARHAARAYAKEGHDLNATLARIRLLFDAEWDHATDTPESLTP